MNTAEEYRLEAEHCEEFAQRTTEPYLRDALTRLARDYYRAARQAERRERDLDMVGHPQAPTAGTATYRN